MPSGTLRWLRAYCGAFTMSFFAFCVTLVLCQKLSESLELVLPSVAALLVLVYMPRILYMWALDLDVTEQRLYRELNREQKLQEANEIEEISEDEDSGGEFPLEGNDGSDIHRKF